MACSGLQVPCIPFPYEPCRELQLPLGEKLAFPAMLVSGDFLRRIFSTLYSGIASLVTYVAGQPINGSLYALDG